MAQAERATIPFGAFDHVAVVEENRATVVNGFGEPGEAWQPVLTAPCAVRQLSAGRRYQAQQVMGEVSHEITLRLDPRIHAGCRCQVTTPDGRRQTHWITGIDRLDPRRGVLVLVTSQREGAS